MLEKYRKIQNIILIFRNIEIECTAAERDRREAEERQI